MKKIGLKPLPRQGQAPVMVLPNATLFRSALMPLRIFEPRYRQMLESCLEGNRMFCVARSKPGGPETGSLADFSAVAGLGLIRACVGCQDGTSNLMLQGLLRVRFTRLLQEKPFRVAAYEELLSPAGDLQETGRLTGLVVEFCKVLRSAGAPVPPAFEEDLSNARSAGDFDLFVDLAADLLLSDPLRRQEVLEAEGTNHRLQVLLQHLREEMLSRG